MANDAKTQKRESGKAVKTTLQKISLDNLSENPDNPRSIEGEVFEKLKKSIAEFPKMMELRPIVVDNNGVVLGGNMRLRALRELEFKQIPATWVKAADKLTEDEKKRFIIIDNLQAGGWAWDRIIENWDTDLLTDWGLEIEFPEIEKLHIEFDADQDETKTFTTQVMIIRNKIAENIKTKKDIKISEAYALAERLIIETLKKNEYYAD